VGEERVALQSFDHGNDTVVPAYSQVIALGNVVGQDHSRRLADAREHGEQNSAFERLGFIDNDKRVVQRAAANVS
jgi:hypothetical protein